MTPKLLRLEDEDVRALRRLSEILGYPEAAIARWALRHYALAGAWRAGPRGIDPGEELYPQRPDLGPDGRGVA